MARDKSNETPFQTSLDAQIALAARVGILDLYQLAFFYCLSVHEHTAELPDAKTIPPGVQRKYRVRITLRTAYRGLDVARAALLHVQITDALQADLAPVIK